MPPLIHELLKTILEAFAAYIGIGFLVMPLLLKYMQRLAVRPGYTPLLAADLPEDAAAYLGARVGELVAEGFSISASFSVPKAANHTSVFTMVFADPVTKDTVAVLFVIRTGAIVIKRMTVEFETKYANGASISTTNTLDPFVLPLGDTRNVLGLRRMENVRLQRQIHRRRCERFAPPGIPPLLSPRGHELQEAMGDHAATLAYAASRGYLRPTADGHWYVPTWSGAYRMAWKMVFPVKQIRRRLQTLEAWRQLKELGIDPSLLSVRSLPSPPPNFGAPLPYRVEDATTSVVIPQDEPILPSPD